MADVILPLGDGTSYLRYKDMGDGTVAEVVSAAGAGGGGGATTIADGASVTLGAKADSPSAWYTATGSVVAKLGLMIAALVDAGSHVYGYNSSGQLITDAWTLFGTTHTKTYTWTGNNLTAESDWV